MSKRTTEELRELGKAGKLYHIEVLCEITIPGQKNDTAKWERSNLTDGELLSLRETIFCAGLALPLSSNTWVIIPPRDIGTVYVDKQSKFFEP